jgi:hypothetical protein
MTAMSDGSVGAKRPTMVRAVLAFLGGVSLLVAGPVAWVTWGEFFVDLPFMAFHLVLGLWLLRKAL